MKYSKNTLITGVSIGLAVISIAFSVFAYFDSIKQREPVLFIDERAIEIFSKRMNEELPISITTNDGRELDVPIYMTTIGFGNFGKESIKRSNILRDIIITINKPKDQIIDFSISSQTREIVGAEIEIFDKSAKSTSYKLNFDILEEQDGIELKILFLGDENTEFSVEGVIEGTRNIEIMKSGYHVTTVGPKHHLDVKNVFLFEKQ
ncbi:hypothetical protein [Inediibacterium massiliense]|uniref:hypothetical protein n=1 Tax=Inediibacterium massiliense TaxID=1658111 RepID=UPI0006B549F3|nr:hypothetical protein [Inediibacterium massiliense]